MKPLITPWPCLNGNTASSLIDQLSDVRNALEKAIHAYADASDVIHGRNFQTQPDGSELRIRAADAWHERFRALDAMREEILQMQLEIQKRDDR